MTPQPSPSESMRTRFPLLLGFLAGLILLAAACAGRGDSSSPADEPAAANGGDAQGDTAGDSAPVSFSNAVEPIITTTCARCHTGSGPGTPHVRMDTAADVADSAADIAALVGAKIMPPWPASSLSVSFVGDWSLSKEEIASLVEWADSGAPLDVDSSKAMVPSGGVFGLDDADAALVPSVPFDGAPSDGDQYRCFVYDPEVTDSAWIQAYEFVPDQTEVVHHAIGFLVPASARARANDLEAEDDAGGWKCFGGSRLGFDAIFLGWAPGQGPVEMPEGSGLKLGPGDFLVIQIHYHFDVDASADSSALHLKFADQEQDLDEVFVEDFLAPAEIPCTTAERGPLCDRSAALERAYERYGLEGAPADFILQACGATAADFAHMTDGIASSSCDRRLFRSGEIVSVLGHEHELGRAFRMTLNPDTPDQVVLLDIPVWDFDWQFNYYPADKIRVKPGDTVRIECTWDRSLRDPDLEPAYVLWADGTDDEMCFATMAIRELSSP